MRTDIHYIISLMKEYTPKTDGELGEQDTPASSAPSSGGGEGYPAVSKWSEVVGGPTRGKANPLGLSSEKWASGVTRGVANQLT
jgi:hypothetical protein